MADGLQALRTYLDDIARRRAALAWRRAWTLGAAVAAVALLVTAGAIRLASPGPLPLVAAVAAGLAVAVAAIGGCAVGHPRPDDAAADRPARRGTPRRARRRGRLGGGLCRPRRSRAGHGRTPRPVGAAGGLGTGRRRGRRSGGPGPRRPHGAGRRGAAAGGAGPVRAPARRRRRRGVGVPAAVAHRDRRRARSCAGAARAGPHRAGARSRRRCRDAGARRRRWRRRVVDGHDPAGRWQLPRHHRRCHGVVPLPCGGRRPPVGRILGHRRAPAHGRADRARVSLSGGPGTGPAHRGGWRRYLRPGRDRRAVHHHRRSSGEGQCARARQRRARAAQRRRPPDDRVADHHR